MSTQYQYWTAYVDFAPTRAPEGPTTEWILATVDPGPAARKLQEVANRAAVEGWRLVGFSPVIMGMGGVKLDMKRGAGLGFSVTQGFVMMFERPVGD